jgi:ribosomal protein L37AE/L43A
MARNSVQMQKGLSLSAFRAAYGSEERCRAALVQWRFPKGYLCPHCGSQAACTLKARRLMQCNRCLYQASLTAGTIFHATKLSLTIWFEALYWLTQTKNGVSALELSRLLGVSYNTAWKVKHKLMQVMLERNQERKLSGLIEVDDAYLGGERSGGKRGRGAAHKRPFVAAVSQRQGRPMRLHLRPVSAFGKRAIAQWATHSLEAGTTVQSDGLACFAAVAQAGCRHEPTVLGNSRRAVKAGRFKWVNTILGNLKNALQGTYHAFSLKHGARYLAEFEYRFNRRFSLPDMIPRLAFVALRTPPMPYRLLKLAEFGT